MSDTNATPEKTPATKVEADEVVVESTPDEVVVVDETPVVVEETTPADVVVDPVADPVVVDAVAEHPEPATVPAETPVVTTDPAVDGTPVVADVGAEPAQTVTGDVSHAAAAPVQTVYVTAPTPPKPKGNRGFGILMSIVATVAFAVLYAGAAVVLLLVLNPGSSTGAIGGFFTNSLFYVPVLVFLVVMILWALLANRTGWWSWVIGSLIVAVVTYFASIGIFILTVGGFGLAPSQATAAFNELASNPALIAAALVARECAIWFGAVIAKRGRKVRERNYATWQAFENEQAQKRAELGGTAAA